MRILVLCLICLIAVPFGWAQPCSQYGSARNHLDSLQNAAKNVTDLPHCEVVKPMTCAEMAALPAPSVFGATYKYAEIRAHVYNVAQGSIESCNCHSKKDRDVHVTLVDDLNHSEGRYRTIAEVTPRMKKWTLKGLSTLKGKLITFGGWLFYDKEHEGQSWNPHHGKNDWRGGCWEIHPITYIGNPE